jgi:hypothetical protein
MCYFSSMPLRSSTARVTGVAEPVLRVAIDETPEPADLGRLLALDADARLARVLAHPAAADDLGSLSRIDPDELSTTNLQLAYSRRVDEVLACAAALQVRVTAVLAGPEPSGNYLAEVAAETEISLARGISPTAAGLEIETARVLSSTFPAFLDALAEGRISAAHCRRLAEATRLVTDPIALEVIGRKALRSAPRLTPGKFADRLDALVAEHDPDARARMARAAESSRDCAVQRLRDGLGRLVYVDEWAKVAAVGDRIRSAGRATQRARRGAVTGPRRAPQPPDAAPTTAAPETAAPETTTPSAHELEAATDAGSCRADAMLALVLGQQEADGAVVLDPSDVVRVEVQVVVDLETLRDEADHVALVDGSPVPGSVGRDWAQHAATFRRMVTDPVTGHLLDKGRVYLARDVRDFVLHRDGGCRVPTCGIRHRDRLQVDHATPYPAGATSSANLGALSTTHHQLKTAGHLDLVASAADGSAVLTTAWGQRIVIPPRPYLREPDPPPEAPPPPDDEVPPF